MVESGRCARSRTRSIRAVERRFPFLWPLRLIDLSKGTDCGRIENGAVGLKLRPVARAVPAFLEAVPVNDAAHMCADGTPLGNGAVVGAISRVLGQAAA